jgi:hypothetical protein
MLKLILKTFCVVLGNGFVLTFVAGFMTWLLTMGNHLWGFGVLVVGCFSYPIGMIFGIVLVNKLLHYQGSLLFGILGFILVVIVVGLIIFFLGPFRLIPGWGFSPVLPIIGLILLFVVVPLSLTLGYCLVNKSTVPQ